MKHPIRVSLLPIIFCLLFNCSTKDQADGNVDQPNTTSPELVSADISIVLPAGTSLDLSKTHLSTLGEDYPINGDGTVKVSILKDSKTFVMVSNADNKIVLYGFVSPDRSELNMTTQLEASLYFQIGVFAQFKEIQDKYLTEFQDLPEIKPFVEELGTQYQSNPLFLLTTEYGTWLQEVSTKLTAKNTIDVGKTILVKDSNIKSGIKVIQDDSNIFDVNVYNYWRRRARAFIYKVAVKKHGDKKLVPIEGMLHVGSYNQTADMELNVAPVTGITNVLGNGFDTFRGDGLDLGASKNGPINLQLNDNEEAAEYLFRVVGMGYNSGDMTDKESSVAFDLTLETYFFDCFLPLVTTAVGVKDINDATGIKIDEGREIMSAILNSTTSGVDELNKGNFGAAFLQCVKAFAFNYVGTEGVYKRLFELLKKTGIKKFQKWDIEAMKTSCAAFFTAVNAPLTVADVVRVLSTQSSNKLESFDVIVSAAKVRIDPNQKGIIKGDKATLKATVVDDQDIQDGEYTYTWRTTGKYGAFETESTTDQTTYVSDANYANLPPDARDSIFVNVYLAKDKSFVGKDSSVVYVSPNKYKIRPNGLTVNGGNQVVLRIVDEENKPIQSNDNVHYKVVWTTDGSYGKFDGSTRSITNIDDNSVVYKCFDKEVAAATETIMAQIYISNTGGLNDEDFVPVQDVDATINIENKENQLIFYTKVGYDWKSSPLVGFPDFTHYEFWSEWKWHSFEAASVIPEGYEVAQVYMHIEERIPDLNPSCTSTGYNTWTLQPGEEMQSDYTLYCGGSGFNVGPNLNVNTLSYMNSLYGSVEGYAKVVVYLRKKS